MSNLIGEVKSQTRHTVKRTALSSGWRLLIGWGCAVAVVLHFVVRPATGIVYTLYTGEVSPIGTDVEVGELLALVAAILGVGGLRTVEKVKGVAR